MKTTSWIILYVFLYEKYPHQITCPTGFPQRSMLENGRAAPI
jgi:hypothetical protein